MRYHRWRILVAAAGAILLIALVIVLGVGHWLVVEDPLEKASVIVVLSGRMPVRALEAAKLYREGYAPEVWLTRNPLLNRASTHGHPLRRRGILQLPRPDA